MRLLLLILSFVFADLNEPQQGQELNYIHVLFNWDQAPDTEYYNLQISMEQFFNSILIEINEETTTYIATENIDWDNTYYWRVRPIYNDGSYGSWFDASYFSTKESILTNLDVNIYNENLIQDGLIMYSQFSPFLATGVIDKYGNEIWNTQNIYMNHVNDYGKLYGLNGPGISFNFDEEILWETPQGTEIDGHEVKQIPNGNYMAFVPTFQTGPIPQGSWTNYFQILGYEADGETDEFPWMGLRIVEFDKETSQEVWSWEPFEHFSMDDCDLYESTWWQAAFNGFFDWMHTNAFHFDEEEGVIYVSHRHLSRISKIAYPSGEIIWNMGLPGEYNTGDDNICTDLLFSFQHHIQLMDDGSLLFFDNGNLSDLLTDDNDPITRIRRIRVIDDSYCETIWQHDLPANLHGLGMGSVQLLDNGNYSIYTYGSGLDDGECSVLEVAPSGELVWKATAQNQNAAWYRAYKIPSIHPDGFSVIANGYILDENNQDVISISGNLLDFTIYNKSGFIQDYNYMFSDLMDGGTSMFLYQEGDFTLGPEGTVDLSFLIENENASSTSIGLSIWPTHHNYSLKEFIFDVSLSNFLVGDINNDGMVNVLDVVILVNIILEQSSSESADINYDGSINVLDIVFLINIILNS